MWKSVVIHFAGLSLSMINDISVCGITLRALPNMQYPFYCLSSPMYNYLTISFVWFSLYQPQFAVGTLSCDMRLVLFPLA